MILKMCDLPELFQNITNNCDADLEVVKDQCKVICMMAITKALTICYFQLFDTGLLDQMKDIIKYCYFEKTEINSGH
tara:strand:+ start:381 stop:611 length:231 start_codon:yes stop_codon:yes gene_type:complete